MKILYVTTISGTMNFFPEHIKMLLSEGHSVEIACSCAAKPVNSIYLELGCKIHDIPFSRSPFSMDNLKAYKILKQLVETEHYDIVHTHTPNASMIARLACRKVRKQGTRVFYTAHGFHFFKGAPLKNWLMYYPIEKFCARFTDVLITINKEDYALAQKKMHAKKVCYVPGVGIDLERIKSVQADRKEVRKSMGVPEDCVLLTSVGELIKRKNHQVVIRAIAKLKNPNVHYAIAGQGALLSELIGLSKELGVEQQVHFLGYRTDVCQIYKASDIAILPSFQEGLPVALMEAMACKIPVICSKIRGCIDLVEKKQEVFNPTDAEELQENINEFIKNPSLYDKFNLENMSKIKDFSLPNVLMEMIKIYEMSGGDYDSK